MSVYARLGLNVLSITWLLKGLIGVMCLYTINIVHWEIINIVHWEIINIVHWEIINIVYWKIVNILNKINIYSV